MGAHNSSFEQKVKWLVDHPDAWKGWPVDEEADKRIRDGMRRDGLISQGSHNYDIGDFGKAIASAKAQIRHTRRNGN